MKTRKGLPGGQYKPLTGQDIQKIHETSLRVFEEIGVEINHPEARDLFEREAPRLDVRAGLKRVRPRLAAGFTGAVDPLALRQPA